MTTTLTFPAPGPLLNMNDRHHWAKKAKAVRAWRDAACDAADEAFVVDLDPCTVTVTLPVKGNRRRDPANYYATVKPIVDGLVEAGVWPDDTPMYVTTTEPVLDASATDVTVMLVPR